MSARASLFSARSKRVSWRLAWLCWSLGLDRLGNHFEDVTYSGKRWLG